jgi:hypothetical protein
LRNRSAQAIDATGNYWGASDGPSGDGPGSGDAIVNEAFGGSVDFSGFALFPLGNTPCSVVPRLAKMDVVTSISDLLPTGDNMTDQEIEKAINEIDKSLDPALWIDDEHLVADKKDAKKVFDAEKKAVKELEKVELNATVDAAAAAAIDALVEADRALAQTALAEAIAAADPAGCPIGSVDPECEQALKEIEKAQEELAKADEDLDNGKPDRAIDHFRKSWEASFKVLEKLPTP